MDRPGVLISPIASVSSYKIAVGRCQLGRPVEDVDGAGVRAPAQPAEMTSEPMRRFYKSVEAVAVDGGHEIRLDGRPVRTPGKAPLALPNAALAAAVAAEWQAQDQDIDPASMPLTQLASTAIDRVAGERETVIAGIVAYAETDLLCHRAERPAALVERQNMAWQPLLDWAALEYDAPLAVTCGVLPVAQPRSSVAAFAGALAGFDDFRLAAVAHLTGLLGSVVLALALAAGRLAAGEAFDAAHLDETYQQEVWGADAEAVARLGRLRAEVEAAARFLTLLDG